MAEYYRDPGKHALMLHAMTFPSWPWPYRPDPVPAPVVRQGREAFSGRVILSAFPSS